ncbi:MAG: pantetheine-phosphate adenylyltransferase [Candidatus Marinimicrobia bacterium]|nr:pantetheine-phosphate adenylyltransferase [Candidatus Neomarinimicrobiota bacterium]|tara:strand:- start:4047 stop:4541 length:495 start_codon:yes stop_codon:yes gene_type:complete
MENKLNIAIYPGSFDPITNGHLDIISRSSKLFDKVIIGISKSSNSKDYLFSDEERLQLASNSTKHIDNVEPIVFDGLLVDFALKNNINVIIRGLRAFSDFESEFQMSLMNRKLNSEITTIFMMPHEKYTHISSSIVKEVFSLEGDISDYVSDPVLKALNLKYEK